MGTRDGNKGTCPVVTLQAELQDCPRRSPAEGELQDCPRRSPRVAPYTMISSEASKTMHVILSLSKDLPPQRFVYPSEVEESLNILSLLDTLLQLLYPISNNIQPQSEASI